MHLFVLLCFAIPSLFFGACYECECNGELDLDALPYDYDLFHKDIEVVTLNSEFLYWSVQQGALDYALKMKAPTDLAECYSMGSVKSANFRISPGFRLSLSYFNAPKYWEIKSQYTNLISDHKNRAHPPLASNEFLTATFGQAISSPLVHAHSSLYLNYNVFDLLIDRMFIPNPHLRIRLLCGLSSTWIRQNWKVQYFNAFSNSTLRNRWRFIGGGMRVGVSADWYWGNNIYLTGATYTTAYMGSYRNRAKQVASSLSSPIRHSDFSDTRPAISIQFSTGPSWQLNYGTHRLELFTGFELISWLNLHEVRRSSLASPSDPKETWLSQGVMTLYGLTTRLTLDF